MAARWRSVLKSKGTTTRWAIVYSSSILLGNVFSVWQSTEDTGNLSFALEPAFFCGLGQSLHCITFFSTVLNRGDGGELLPKGPALPRMRSQRARSLFPSKDLGGNSF